MSNRFRRRWRDERMLSSSMATPFVLRALQLLRRDTFIHLGNVGIEFGASVCALCECVQCSILIASFAFVKFFMIKNTFFCLFVGLFSHFVAILVFHTFTLIPTRSKSKFELNPNQSHLIFCISLFFSARRSSARAIGCDISVVCCPECF